MGELRQPANRIHQTVNVNTWPAAKSREKRMAFQRGQHVTCRGIRDRREPHSGISEQFDHDPAKTHRDQWTELSIILHPEHDFEA